jgi:hypothetical protein
MCRQTLRGRAGFLVNVYFSLYLRQLSLQLETQHRGPYNIWLKMEATNLGLLGSRVVLSPSSSSILLPLKYLPRVPIQTLESFPHAY